MISQLKGVAGELWGLFVDDGVLAVLALAWIALAALVVRGQAGPAPSGGLAALFA